MASYYKNVSVAEHLREGGLHPLEKQGKIYVAPFANGPIHVKTPVVTVSSVTENGIWITPNDSFRAFLAQAEETFLEVALANADEWKLSPERVQEGFKSFFRDEDGAVKFRAAADLAVFDANGELVDPDDPEQVIVEGATVRMVIGIGRLSLGRTELGGLWHVVQARRAAQPPECVVEATDPAAQANDDTAAEAGALDPDAPGADGESLGDADFS